jgi:hypothetical protein
LAFVSAKGEAAQVHFDLLDHDGERLGDPLVAQSRAASCAIRRSRDRNALVRLGITPGERFARMIETLFGLARRGHTNTKGMPNQPIGRLGHADEIAG